MLLRKSLGQHGKELGQSEEVSSSERYNEQ